MTRAAESRTYLLGRGGGSSGKLGIEFTPGKARGSVHLVSAGKRHKVTPDACLAIADTLRLAALSAKANRNLFQVLSLEPSPTEESHDA